jgi:Icc-related predicted phosphoesterase
MADGEKETITIAAMGDLHVREESRGKFRTIFAKINAEADVLLLCGDLTDSGHLEEAHALADDISHLTIPVYGVLGNHDYNKNHQAEIRRILMESNMHFLDRETTVIGKYGIAGVKGFGGGFGSHMLASFGEEAVKQFVGESVSEALKLESQMNKLGAEKMIVALHYSPIVDTVKGEPPEIYVGLGSSRLAETIDRFPVSAVFHGHSHFGTFEGKTIKGTPVYNCALPVLQKQKGLEYLKIEL